MLIAYMKAIEIDVTSSVFNDQDIEFDNDELTNLDSITEKRRS